MRLLLAHPEVAGRTCTDCQRFLYRDTATGLSPKKALKADGKPMERPRGSETPCRLCPKIPLGETPRPENAIELSPRNHRAYWHYCRCKATASFPDDPIVRRNAALIRMVEDSIDRERGDMMPMLLALLGRGQRT